MQRMKRNACSKFSGEELIIWGRAYNGEKIELLSNIFAIQLEVIYVLHEKL